MLGKFQKIGTQILLVSSVLLPVLAAEPAAVSPQAMRGIWFEDNELGQRRCRQYNLSQTDALTPDALVAADTQIVEAQQSSQTGELIPGTLVIADTQIAEAQQGVQETLLFLTQVVVLGEDTWQVFGLSDPYPYEAIKELKTYGFSLSNQRLYRAVKEMRGGKEILSTQVYIRCL
ncbi:hypothetical protein [Ottowia sp.]|uniref:hypothetical protein n=1 Tax=Ottowia sp. TaxID=1898956 RepID=UPI003A8B4DB6